MTVAISVDLPLQEAWALAEFLKRSGFSDFRTKAATDEEAYRMQDGAETIRKALAEAGVAPR